MDKGLTNRIIALLLALVMAFVMLPITPALAQGEDIAENPEGLTATSASSGSIRLTWAAQEGAMSYLVFRATEADGDYTALALINETEYVDNSATLEQTYYYMVKSVNKNFILSDTEVLVEIQSGDTESVVAAHSEIAPALLPPPTGAINARAVSYDQINLFFNRVEGALGYSIKRALSATGNYLEVGTIADPGGTEQVMYEDKGLEAETTYYYKIATIDAEGVGVYITGYVDATTWNHPSGMGTPVLSISRDSSDPATFILTWPDVSGATSYRIYRAKDSDDASAFIQLEDFHPGSPYVDDSAKVPGSTYYYYIVAENATTRSENSNIVNLDVPNPGLEPPYISVNLKPGEETTAVVTWEEVDGANSYEVYRKERETDDFVSLGFVNVPEYEDPDKTPSSTYWYKVVAIGDIGRSPDSNIEFITIPDNLPGTIITDGYYLPGTNNIEIVWDHIEKADRYEIQMKTPGTSFTTLTTVNKPATTQVFNNLPKGITYTFRIYTRQGALVGPVSNEYTVKEQLPAALKLTAEGTSTSTIDVNWQQVDGNNGYKLYRSDTENGTYTPIADLGKNVTSHQDTGLPQNTTYWYKVFAIDAEGELGLESNKDDGTTFKSQLPAALKLIAEGTSTSTIDVNWQQVDGNYGYKLYRSNTENGTYSPIANLGRDVNYFQDTGLPQNTTYWYKVYAIDSYGELGLESNKDDGTTWKEKCTIIVKVCPYTYCCNTKFGNLVSWSSVKGATSYKVYRSVGDESNYQLIATTRYTSFDNTCLNPNTTYYYKIVANTGEEGVGCGTTPGKSFYFKACNGCTYNRELTVNLTWQYQAGISYYTIYRSANNKDWEVLTQVSGSTTKYVDRPVSPSRYYYYKLVGSNGRSEQACVYTCSQSLSLCATCYSGYIKLSWYKISNAKTYTIYRSTDNKNYTQIACVDANTLTTMTYCDYSSKVKGQKYYYKVVTDNGVTSSIVYGTGK